MREEGKEGVRGGREDKKEIGDCRLRSVETGYKIVQNSKIIVGFLFMGNRCINDHCVLSKHQFDIPRYIHVMPELIL